METQMETQMNQVEQKRKPGRPKGSGKKKRGRKPIEVIQPRATFTYAQNDLRLLIMAYFSTLPIEKLLKAWQSVK